MQNTKSQKTDPKATALPDRIVVATDLGDTDFLVPFVVAQARECKAHVTLVNALVPADSIPAEAGLPYTDFAKIEQEVRTTLLVTAREIEKEGVRCDVIVHRGIATDVIREQIYLTGARRLIIGTHGRGKLGQLVIGSVANELLRTVDIPVFTVGPHARGVAVHALPQRVLHPVSLVGDHARSMQFARNVANAYGAELTLLHVIERNKKSEINPERELQWARNALMALVPGEPSGVIADAAYGKPAEEICAAALRLHVDLIVMGVNSDQSFWPLSDSSAYKVIAAAQCPVLTLPHNLKAESKTELQMPHFAGADA